MDDPGPPRRPGFPTPAHLRRHVETLKAQLAAACAERDRVHAVWVQWQRKVRRLRQKLAQATGKRRHNSPPPFPSPLRGED